MRTRSRLAYTQGFSPSRGTPAEGSLSCRGDVTHAPAARLLRALPSSSALRPAPRLGLLPTAAGCQAPGQPCKSCSQLAQEGRGAQGHGKRRCEPLRHTGRRAHRGGRVVVADTPSQALDQQGLRCGGVVHLPPGGGHPYIPGARSCSAPAQRRRRGCEGAMRRRGSAGRRPTDRQVAAADPATRARGPQGWRLDPLLLFGQLMTTGAAVSFGIEALKLRSQVFEAEVRTHAARQTTRAVAAVWCCSAACRRPPP